MHLASWGFVVIDSYSETTGTGLPLIEAIQRLEEENNLVDGALYGKADMDKLATCGHSQGSTGAINAYTNYEAGKIIQTVVSISLPALKWCDEEDRYDTSKLNVPFMILTGTQDQIISSKKSGMEAFDALPENVEGVFLDARYANHLEIEGDGGRFRSVLTAWMLYRLYGDEEAGQLFYDVKTELKTSSAWQYFFVK